MEETISAANAKRKFSLLLRGVGEGRTYVVTCHGKPVARIIPVESHEALTGRARTALLTRLEAQPIVKTRKWTREELYAGDR